jgi:hypothetical protein
MGPLKDKRSFLELLEYGGIYLELRFAFFRESGLRGGGVFDLIGLSRP